MAILYFGALSAIYCHKNNDFQGFRGFLEQFWGQKTESIEQNGAFSAQCFVISVFFSLFANDKRGTFQITSRRSIRYVPTQCQIRPDAVPDTSRRIVGIVLTRNQVHPDVSPSTSQSILNYILTLTQVLANANSSTCERYFKYLRTQPQVLAKTISNRSFRNSSKMHSISKWDTFEFQVGRLPI